ncbi:MAG: hypothetical protein KBA06_04525 [Saprospiraceae bacterium]|nr:hypothetical protein [Saprospiraceae bacterium]
MEESCNTLFSSDIFEDNSAMNKMAFLESIFESLLRLSGANQEVKFSQVNHPLKELPGIYDFTFSRISIENQIFIVWLIYDYTELYESYRSFQQQKNEFEIFRQKLELQLKHIEHKHDISTKKQILISSSKSKHW